MFDEFIDRFPADFCLNEDSTYSYQPSRRSLTELGGSGLVHTQHSAGTFLLRKPYLKAKTHLKTLLGLNLGELGFVTALSISSATGGALSHEDFRVLHNLGPAGPAPVKGACSAPSAGLWKSSSLGRSCHAWVVSRFK